MRKQTFLLERIPGQIRLAVFEDDSLRAVYSERDGEQGLSGNIYMGRVQNVIPGMNAAFIDIGKDKNAFLPLDEVPAEVRSGGIDMNPSKNRVHPGQEIAVQVTHEPGGSKGCRVSANITLPSVYTVLLPDASGVGVSKKITDEAKRESLRNMVNAVLGEGGGFGVILRTVAENVEQEELREELETSIALWRKLKATSANIKAPALLYRANSLMIKLALDLIRAEECEIICDGEALYSETVNAMRALNPSVVGHIRKYDSESPLFDLYRVDDGLDKAMKRCVYLKHGGNLVIDETEAMTVIDVNTSANTRNASPEETAFRQNAEAAEEIVRLARLREWGGIIIADFIDMNEEKHREEILRILREGFSYDPNRTSVLGFTKLGLVEMTRRKTYLNMSKQLMHVCDDCAGEGRVFSHDTRALRLIRELWSRKHRGQEGTWIVRSEESVLNRVRHFGIPEDMTVYALRADADSVTAADRTALPAGATVLK